MCPKDFKILKNENEVRKLWDLLISHDMTCEYHGKKLSKFHTFCYIRCLQIEISLKKFHIVHKYMFRFECKIKFELRLDFQKISILLLLIRGSFWGLHVKPPRILGGQSRKKEKLKKPPHEATYDPRWTV
jgi:hypothetical protein